MAVLNEKGLDEDAAKSEVASLTAPAELDFALDPRAKEFLAPVVTALGQQGLNIDAEDLVSDAVSSLAGLCVWDTTQLDERVRELYDDEARAARLRELARGWAGELRLLSLLIRANEASATAVRSEAAQIDEVLGRPEMPSRLEPVLEELVPGLHLAGLRHKLRDLLVDDLPGAPADRSRIHRMAEAQGVMVAAAPTILKILNRDRSQRVSAYTYQARALVEHDVQPRKPAGLTPPSPRKPAGTRKHVVPGKVWISTAARGRRGTRRSHGR